MRGRTRLLAVVLVCTAVGCSSSTTPDAGTSFGGDTGTVVDAHTAARDTGTSTSHDAALSDAHDSGSTTPDASMSMDVAIHHDAAPTGMDSGEAGGPCGGAEAEGELVQQVQSIGANPTGTGGLVSSGSYVLSALYDYPDSPDAGVRVTSTVARKTLVLDVAAGKYSFAQAVGTVDAGAGIATTTGGTFLATGTMITLTQTCPGTGTATYSYSATTTTLSLYQGEDEEDYHLESGS